MAYQGKHRRKRFNEPHKHKSCKRPKREKPPSQSREIARCQAEEYRELKTSLNLPSDWDVLLVGDGSIQHHTGTCGWAVTLYERATKCRKVFYGAGSSGDCQFAELVPYVHAMLWYSRSPGGKPAGKAAPPKYVHIVTDSRTTAVQGNHIVEFLENPLKLKTTRFLWETLQQLTAAGYVFNWYWRKRGNLAANRRMNRLAQTARWQFASQQHVTDMEPPEDSA